MEEQASVLIVDDDPLTRLMTQGLLTGEGYRLSAAGSGCEALERVAASPPDAILLDVMMPGMNGFDACRAIKSNPDSRHIPVILVTALDGPEPLVEGLDAGADDFLTKPVSGVELKARVRSMLRIKRQYDELAATLRLRDELAHMIVHDMRSPIMAIQTLAELLDGDGGALEGDRLLLKEIREAADRLNGFSNEILMTSKLEQGRFVLSLRPVDVAELVTRALERHARMAHARGMAMRCDMRLPSGHLLHLDSSIVERVLDNLLSNALKYAPPHTSIVVTVEPRDSARGIRIGVADCGEGIAPDDRERIFQKYEIAQTRREGVRQTGLGLYFCRLAVEAHGGAIRLEPNQPHGSVFVVEL